MKYETKFSGDFDRFSVRVESVAETGLERMVWEFCRRGCEGEIAFCGWASESRKTRRHKWTTSQWWKAGIHSLRECGSVTSADVPLPTEVCCEALAVARKSLSSMLVVTGPKGLVR